jgi:hypothetical protein
METNDWLHTLATLAPGIEPPISTGQVALQDGTDVVAKRKNVFTAPARNRTPVIQPKA